MQLGRFAQDAQVAAAGAFGCGGRFQRRVGGALPRGRGRRAGRSLTDGVRQGEEVVRTWLGRLRGHGEAKYFPAARDGERIGVLLAKVIAVRLGIGCQRAEDGGGVRVDVRQSCHRRLAAG